MNHIPDEDLRQVVDELPTAQPQETIESHLAECQHCQSRLMEVAAGLEWREQFNSSVADLRPETSTWSSVAASEDSRLVEPVPAGDQFDLETLKHLLQDILEPSIHPEMMGRLGRYDVEAVIGCGGMGAVLRGFDRNLHRPVAIKIILPRLARNGTAKQRFAREARAAAAVLHPNVIGIHGIEESKGVPWFVMPLVAGPSLQQLIQEHGPLPVQEIVRIGLQVAAGLAAAHSQGLVHRDIKPANILVDNQVNRVVITDFGLAHCEAEESMTQTGWLAGTLNYMSPEQSRGEELDARSDLFSFGSLLFYLSTGVVPFRAESALGVLHQIGNTSHPRVQTLNPEIHATLAAIIDRLLAKTPGQRFQSAAELEAVFTDYLAHLHQPVSNPLPSVSPPSAQRGDPSAPKTVSARLRYGLAAATGAGLVALVGWLIAITQPGESSDPPEPRLTWSSVAERHNLPDPNQMERQLVQLEDDLEVAWQGLNALDRYQVTDDLNLRMTRFDAQLQDLNSRIGGGFQAAQSMKTGVSPNQIGPLSNSEE